MENCSVPVVQKVDNTIHRINLYPLNSPTLVFLILVLILWIVIYPMNSTIQPLNRMGLLVTACALTIKVQADKG